jgi:hypothetical protein
MEQMDSRCNSCSILHLTIALYYQRNLPEWKSNVCSKNAISLD